MSRIKSSNIQLGNSYVLNTSEEKPEEMQKKAILMKAQQQIDEITNNAKIEASKLIEAAKEKQQEIIQQANDFMQQSQDAVNQAKAEGYQVGHEEGYRQIHSEFVDQINSIEILAQSSFKVKQEVIAGSEQEVLQLAIVIAEKIIRQQLEMRPEIILNIVKAAINELKDKEEINILVNPQLTKYLYDFSEELKQTVNGLETVKIMEDKTIPMDGVIVESSGSRIDARLESQIAEITRQLMKESEENPVLAEIPEEIEIKIEEPKKKKGNKST